MKPMILLQTDFSNTWGAVASMKGVIKIVDPSLEIYDLCHDIKKFDPWEASLSLSAVAPYWRAETIIVSVVDPGVGTDRRASVALLDDGKYVITPDNGTLTHLKHEIGIREIRSIDTAKYHYSGNESVSVFHGRDIFAYCAALLASGKVSFEEMGEEYPVSEVVECEEYAMKPRINGNDVETWIMTGLAHFGGVQLGITNAEWRSLDYKEGDRVHVEIYRSEREGVASGSGEPCESKVVDAEAIDTKAGELIFSQDVVYGSSFGDVAVGEPILYCGSSLHLCLDCNQDSFMEKFGVGFGREYKVRLVKAM